MLRAYPGLSGADMARVALLTPRPSASSSATWNAMGPSEKAPHPVHGRVLQWTLTRRGACCSADAGGT